MNDAAGVPLLRSGHAPPTARGRRARPRPSPRNGIRRVARARDRVEVHRAATLFDLDPSLADPRWSEGALTGPLFDLGTKSLAGVTTAASFWYDDRALYVGVRAEQKTPVVATQATDDVGYGTDDFVGVLLDVSGNGARTYMFAVTPRGTRYAFAGETARFKPEWSAAAKTTDTGWNAVLRIPYEALKLAADGPQPWRINLVRNVAATAEHETLADDALMSYQTIPGWPDLSRDWRYWPRARGVTLSGAVPRPKAARRSVRAGEHGHRQQRVYRAVRRDRAPRAAHDGRRRRDPAGRDDHVRRRVLS